MVACTSTNCHCQKVETFALTTTIAHRLYVIIATISRSPFPRLKKQDTQTCCGHLCHPGWSIEQTEITEGLVDITNVRMPHVPQTNKRRPYTIIAMHTSLEVFNMNHRFAKFLWALHISVWPQSLVGYGFINGVVDFMLLLYYWAL